MDQATHNKIVSFIWGIADDVLRDLFKRGKYPDVILPMCVIRRMDAVLESTKGMVLEQKERLDKAGITQQHAALCSASGQAFYNTSKFTLRDLTSRGSQQQLLADFEDYLNGFSPNVQDILENFKFRNQLSTLSRSDSLGTLIGKFLDPEIDLSPAGIDNHAMGTVFEELVRKFNEENNEEAGEHWTPRDAVRLMANLVFLPIEEQIKSGLYLLYDCACGTGGMLTVAEETLNEIASRHGQQVEALLFGQEINPETFAICKADMLLKGEGQNAENIVGGAEWSTLSHDAFPAKEFDFMLANPPYGKSWKKDLESMGGKDGMRDPRFKVMHRGEELSLVTRSSDGQMLFLANMAAKMNGKSALGSRIAEVHNGSSLFTGDAGQGESNIRRWIIENDWLEAIVALPLNMFYNTGIATYVWVLSNRKPEHRKGKVQLIDATEWYKPLRKNLGKKNCELSPADIDRIMQTFLDFKETEQSKIFPNEAFGYWKVTVERPLRLTSQLTHAAIESLRFASGDEDLRSVLYDEFGDDLFTKFAEVSATVKERLENWGGDAADDEDDEESPSRKGLSERKMKKVLDPKTWSSNSRRSSGATDTALASVYHYDLLNRIRSDSTRLRGTTAWSAVGSHWQSEYTYDGNGNITTLYRNNASGSQMDALTYEYISGTNKLVNINDYQGASTGADIGDQNGNNYAYDATGNMTQDTAAGIEAGGIVWSPYNKIKSITKMGDDTTSKLVYLYDATGNRILKRYYKPYNTLKSTTWYVRDAQGNTLATYTKPSDSTTARQKEVMLYGSTRLAVAETHAPYSDSETDTLGIFDRVSSRMLGEKRYELTDHLGNVRATVSDVVIDHSGNLDAEISTRTDYYPFGMIMGDRNSSLDDSHRYGFNGKENDNEVKGEGVQQDYGFRIYDARVARFLSVDPFSSAFPGLTPYQFANNTPVWAIDLDGAEARIYTETIGTGHAFLTLGSGENTMVFTYGRYLDNDWFTGTTTGSGILIRYVGEDAKKYIASELHAAGARAYEITDADEDIIKGYLNTMWSNGELISPDKTNDQSLRTNARIVDTYFAFGNNCTTKTSDAIKAGGSEIFEEEIWFVEYDQDFLFPQSLERFLSDKSEASNSNVLDVTTTQRKNYQLSNGKPKSATNSQSSSGSATNSSGSTGNSSSGGSSSSGNNTNSSSSGGGGGSSDGTDMD